MNCSYIALAITLTFSPYLIARAVAIDTREGTWLSVDVARDGSLVFDLLGDIYSSGERGGEARRLTQLPKQVPGGGVAQGLPQGGQPFDSQPRLSPDGREIVFVSDRDGADNLYCMKPDGTGLRRITSGREVMSSPAWSRDGRFIAVRRGMAGELWVYRSDGSGGNRVDTGMSRVSGPEFDVSGDGIFFSAPGKTGQQIWRYDRHSGKTAQVTQNFGGAVRPRLSPDGTRLAYITFEDGKGVLRIRDLQSGADRLVHAGVEQPLFFSSGGRLDLHPGYAFSPDGKAIILSFEGKLHRVTLSHGEKYAEIPFQVRTEIQVGPAAPREARAIDGEFPVRMLHWPKFAPSGSRAVFDALGKIWVLDTAGGKPRRLTSSTVGREYAPAISPDGRWVAYVTWSDKDRGQVMKVPVEGGAPVRLTRVPGYYAAPSWSPDGTKIAVALGGGADLQERTSIQDLSRTLGWISANGPSEFHGVTTLSFPDSTNNVHLERVRDTGPRWNRDGTRLWYTQSAQLRSVRLDGADERTHLKLAVGGSFEDFDVPCDFVVSPDETQVAFMARNNEIWVAPMPWSTAKPMDIDVRNPGAGVREITTLAGYFPEWRGMNELTYTFAGRLFRFDMRSGKTATIEVGLTARAPSPEGLVALTGASLITGRAGEIVRDAVVVIRGNRIEAAGPADSVPVPGDARRINVAGRYVMPGLIDVHDHILMGSTIRNWPEQDSYMAAALAYGVTTFRDVSAANIGSFYLSELLNSGNMRGPRAYESGQHLLPPLVQIRNSADAARTVAIQRELGAIVLKEYQQPARRDWQLLADAARSAGMMITAEGSIDFKSNVTRVIDGFTQTEHMWAYHPLYDDAVQLARGTGVTYTPTLGTSAAGSEFWYARMDVDGDPVQKRWLKHSDREHLWRRILGQKIAPEWRPIFELSARNAARMLAGGVNVAVGSHDEPTPTGLGTHWEMWSYVQGGMSPIDAIRCGTLLSARAIGLEKDLGTIEAGKLADLLILDADPVQDIRNTTKIRAVMANGFLLDGASLKRIENLH